jgi:hypothetical protein
MYSLHLLRYLMRAAVLRAKIKETRCIKIQAINKLVASDNGMTVYRTLCSAEYHFMILATFCTNLATAILKLHATLPRGFRVELSYTKCAQKGRFVVCINAQLHSRSCINFKKLFLLSTV